MKTKQTKRTFTVIRLGLATIALGTVDMLGGAVLLANWVPDTPLFRGIFSMGAYLIMAGVFLLLVLSLYKIRKPVYSSIIAMGAFFMAIFTSTEIPEHLKDSFVSTSDSEQDIGLFNTTDDDSEWWGGDSKSTWSEDEALSAGIGSYQWWDRQ